MKESIRNVLALVGFGLILIAIFTLIDKNDLKVTAPIVPTVAPVATVAPVETGNLIRDSYMEGCDIDGSLTVYCDCTYDHLLGNLGRDEMYAMFMRYADDNMTVADSDALGEAIGDCLKFM